MSEPPSEQPASSRWMSHSIANLVLGILSIPLALFFIFGVLAVITGRKERMRIQKSSGPSPGATAAFVGMMLGFASFLLAPMILFSLPMANLGHERKVRTLTHVVALESSINVFYTEYGALPNVGRRVTTDSPEGRKLLAILLGLDEKSDKPLNPRAIKFLSVNEGKANSKQNGLIWNASGDAVEGLYDPWGSPYTVELDVEYKEQLHFTIASQGIDLIGRRVAVYSPGPDNKLGTADDVKNG